MISTATTRRSAPRRPTRSKRSTWAVAACTTRAAIVQDSVKGKVEVDFDTARRLFTLICVLHWKG